METDALINAFFSFIIPGLGQAINGYKKKGIAMFLIAVILALIMYLYIPGIVGNIIYYAFCLISAIDAFKTY